MSNGTFVNGAYYTWDQLERGLDGAWRPKRGVRNPVTGKVDRPVKRVAKPAKADAKPAALAPGTKMAGPMKDKKREPAENDKSASRES